MTLQNSLVTYVERDEYTYEIKKNIERCKIFSYDGSVNEIGCRDKDKPYNDPRYS